MYVAVLLFQSPQKNLYFSMLIYNPCCLMTWKTWKNQRKKISIWENLIKLGKKMEINSTCESGNFCKAVSFLLLGKYFYASLSSEDACSDWQLTFNFELWIEIFCVPTCFHMRIPKLCLSVPQENKSPLLHPYQSYTSNWCINRKVFTSTYLLQHGKH